MIRRIQKNPLSDVDSSIDESVDIKVLIWKLEEAGYCPTEVSPGKWLATCPCCGEPSLEIVDLDSMIDQNSEKH